MSSDLDELREAIMDEGSLPRRRRLLAEFETAVGEKIAQAIKAGPVGLDGPGVISRVEAMSIAREVTGGSDA